jgi:hypothetical protein
VDFFQFYPSMSVNTGGKESLGKILLKSKILLNGFGVEVLNMLIFISKREIYHKKKIFATVWIKNRSSLKPYITSIKPF